MPYNTRAILVDANGKPIPQLYNPFIDGFEPVQGRNGATRVELYDASGNPITVTSGKLAVRATELEALLDGLESALGTQADAEATGNGSIIGILKRLRTILSDVWVDAANAVNVQMIGRKAAVPSHANYSQSLNAAAGGQTTITIRPPAGELWRIRLLGFWFPAISGATGTHQVDVYYSHPSADEARVLSATNSGTATIQVRGNIITSANTKFPANNNEQQLTILNLVLSYNAPLHIRYTNNTDKSQTGTCYIYLIREVEYVAS